MLFRLGADVGDINVSVRVALRHHDAHAAHLRGGRIRAVRGFGNQAHVALRPTIGAVIRTDCEQAGVFALRTGVGLQTHRVIAGDRDQHRFEAVDQFAITMPLRGGRERMDVGELRPGHRNHLGGRVQFHRARTERDHGAIHRQILVGKHAHVAQHLVFAVVRIEHRMREELRGAQQFLRDQRWRGCIQRVDVRQFRAIAAEDAPQQFDVGARGGFIQRDADVFVPSLAQIRAHGHRARHDRVGALVRLQADRVERAGVMGCRESQLLQTGAKNRGQARDARGDAGQAVRTVVDGVHRRHHREQHLRGADVAGRLFAADVLLARLQSQAIRLVAMRIHRHADQASRQRALVGIATGHERRVRAAEAERHAETLRVADDDVRAHLARRLEQGQREQIGGKNRERALGVDFRDFLAPIHQPAARGRILDQHRKVIVGRDRGVPLGGGIGLLDRQAQRLGARAHDLERLRMRIAERHDDVAFCLGRTLGERHRLGGCGGFVQHRSVGDFHAGQVGNHGLEIDQRFHAAL